MCTTAEYDLIVLDLMIPKMPGTDVLRTIRTRDGITPIIILTAISEMRSTIDLRGADDGMTKPLDRGELLARSHALIRRGKGQKEAVPSFGTISLPPTDQTVSRGGQGPGSLAHGMSRPRIPDSSPQADCSSRELLEHLYDFTWEHHSNVIEAHISNLRRKLRSGTQQTVVENLRGRGYRLCRFR